MRPLKRPAAAALVALFLSASGAVAQQSCPAGQGRLREGEPCIPSHLRDYLYCLQNSGGGRIEVVKKDDATKSGNLEVAISGKGSGVVIKGEGAGNIKQSEASRVVKELNEKLDPTLTKNCKDLAIPRAAAQPSPARQTATAATNPTGDQVIDKVQQNLSTLRGTPVAVPESKVAETLAPLFSRPAFYAGIREENWNYFLFVVSKTRLLLEENIRYFKANPETRDDLGQVVRLMVVLQNDVASLYGPNFSVTDHIRRYVYNRDAFTSNLPPILHNPDYNFFDARDVTIRQIRELLKPHGLVSF